MALHHRLHTLPHRTIPVMKRYYLRTERAFERLTSGAMAILGNSLTFIGAVVLVCFWLTNKRFYTQDIHSSIGDVMLGVAFLTLFIIQKSFNHFSASLHLKVNELVSSHIAASNAVLNAEERSEEEIIALSKEYVELAEQTIQQEHTIGTTIVHKHH